MAFAAHAGEITFSPSFDDAEQGYCRIKIVDGVGEPVQLPEVPYFAGFNTVAYPSKFDAPDGQYTATTSKGPEWRTITTEFTVDDATVLAPQHPRIADMAAEGWYPGDLHIHRDISELAVHVESENLAMAPAITWWRDQTVWTERDIPERLIYEEDGRFWSVMGGEDERGHGGGGPGAFLFFGLQRPIALPGHRAEYPAPVHFMERVKVQGGWVDIEKPFWWDVPTAIAHGYGDSIGLANNHMVVDGLLDNEAWGRPRDRDAYPPPRGNGLWSQFIYYQLLNCGIRIPPSAGSASGVIPNPVGYNRVYVHLENGMSHDDWWEGLRAGRSFVTNGPLLRVTANGELPGHVFKSEGPIEIQIAAKLDAGDYPVPSVEVVKNGLAQPIDMNGAAISFEESGWFIVRAIADHPDTFRFASTAPFYVEIGDAPRRVSKASAEFFVDWVAKRMQQIHLDDLEQQEDVIAYHQMALAFWRDKANYATAE